MDIVGFAVPWDRLNQAIVSLYSYRKENPTWVLTVFYDDALTRKKLESVYDKLRYVEVDDADAVAVVNYALNDPEVQSLLLLDPSTVCNGPIVDIAQAKLGDQALVIRPDRPFELSRFNDGYPRLDPDHLDRYMRSRSYFSLGVVVFNLPVLRDSVDCADFYSNYLRVDCLDRGMPKHYLNRVLSGVKKGLLPGHINVKVESALHKVFSSTQCMRHQVRMRQARIVNFSSPKPPWEDVGGIDRLFIQMPYRLYCNVATPVADHLDPEFYAQVKHNAKRQLDRFGDFDKAFETMYDVASL